MIRLGFRDINQDFALSPEQAELKSKLLESINTSDIDEHWSQFRQSVESDVSDVVDNYIASIINNDDRHKKVMALDAAWQQLTDEQKRGLEGDKISDEGFSADNELEEYKNELTKMYDKVKQAMIAQIISWKVD
jgi:hypothetical protein